MKIVNLTEKEILDLIGLVQNEINYIEVQGDEFLDEKYFKRLKSIKGELENKI